MQMTGGILLEEVQQVWIIFLQILRLQTDFDNLLYRIMQIGCRYIVYVLPFSCPWWSCFLFFQDCVNLNQIRSDFDEILSHIEVQKREEYKLIEVRKDNKLKIYRQIRNID